MKTIRLAALLFLATSCMWLNAQSVEWAKHFGGSGADEGQSVVVDKDRYIYITGYFTETADLDPGPGTFNLTSAGAEDAYVSKLDPDGNLVWAKSISGPFSVHGYSVAVDDSGNVYVAGAFRGTVDFDPGEETFEITSFAGYDIFVVKLNASGDFAWAERAGGTGNDYCRSVAVDSDGNVYTTGYFFQYAKFGSDALSLLSLGGFDAFIWKLDASGSSSWVKKVGGSNTDRGLSVAVDENDNVYVSGIFNGGADFNVGPAPEGLYSQGGADAFILKLEASGNFVWVKHLTSPSDVLCRSIAIHPDGFLYATGLFEETADFNPEADPALLMSKGMTDIFVLKIDLYGNHIWVKQMGGPGSDEGFAISLDESGNVYTTGWFELTADFDPGPETQNLSAESAANIYVSKLSTEGNFEWATAFGGPDSDRGYGIAIDPNNDVITTGYFNQTVDFNPLGEELLLSSYGNSDGFVHKLNQTYTSALPLEETPVTFYPNPFTSFAVLRSERALNNASIRVINALGQPVQELNNLHGNTVMLQRNNLPAGLYFIHIQDEHTIDLTIRAMIVN